MTHPYPFFGSVTVIAADVFGDYSIYQLIRHCEGALWATEAISQSIT
jgi:hypothetical protein